MKRRVIKQGNQAYTITLPVSWVRENSLEKNKEVEVEVQERSIIISTSNIGKAIKANLNVNYDKKTLYRHLSSLYAKGIDEITLTSEKDISADITKVVQTLIGYVLVEQHGSKYVIKDISSSAETNLDEIFKRVFQMILLFQDSAIKDIFGKQEEKLSSLCARDLEVNKFCLFLQRAINKKMYGDVIDGRVLFTLSYDLEKISDEISKMWRANIEYDFDKSEDVRKIVEMSKECLEMAFAQYYRFNSQTVKKVYDLRNKIRDCSLNIKRNNNLERFVRHVVKIAEGSSDLTHLVLMRNL